MRKRKIDSPPLLIRPEFRRLFSSLNNEEAGMVFIAIMEYRWDGVVADLPDKLKGVFLALQAFADEDAESYKAVCEANRENAVKRWSNGINE